MIPATAVSMVSVALVFVVVFIGIVYLISWLNRKYTIRLQVFNWDNTSDWKIDHSYHDNAVIAGSSEKEIKNLIIPKKIEPSTTVFPPGFEPVEVIDLEALAQELCVAMEEEDTVLLGENELCGTLGYAKKFLDLVEHLMKELDMDIPVPALFVAPNDLLDHAVNLKKYAEVFLMRE